MLARQGSMIGGCAKPLGAPPLLPPCPARRVVLASCAAEPAALAPVADTPPAHADAAPTQRPEETAPAPAPSSSPSPLHVSAALSRWSRGRTLRSGRRLSRSSLSTAPVAPPPPSLPVTLEDGLPMAGAEEDGDVCLAERVAATGKTIYMVSDGTGETAEHAVRAALGQFEDCIVDHKCSVNTHLFSGVVDMDRLVEIIKQAAKEGALVLYTLADPSMVEAIKTACNLWGVPSTDVLRPTVDAIASHIDVAPSGIPRSSPSRKGQLTEDYFRRIEAVDFTIKQDDGAQPQNLHKAHIVLVGVSRTGKTPLSIYLAQKGYKVANVPIVKGVPLPKDLFKINQDKIFGLTINPVILQAIRKARAKTLGFFDGHQSNYAEMDHVRHELVHANKIYAQNPSWPVIEVTGKAVEETAAVVLRIYHDRKQKCSMPRISKIRNKRYGICPLVRRVFFRVIREEKRQQEKHISVNDMDRLIEIIKQAAKEGALVLYTLVDPSMAEAVKKACDFWSVPSTDVLRPIVDAIASHIGVAPSGIPRSSPSRQGQLTEDYFRRIDAVEFTIKQDDGAQPQNLSRAHIVLVGVSRTGKTPLSIYLAQKGYKVANVPVVMGVDLPKSLFEISQDKIFALTINPVVLQAIRQTRAKTLGFDGHESNYAEMEHVRQELDHANKLFSQNPVWPVIEITGKAIEETAAVIVRIYHDRNEKCSMPRISKRVAPVLVYNYNRNLS